MAGSTQNNPGDFAAMAIAMTPGPSASPTSQGPTGTTPNAKRPMDKNSITVAQTGVRLMTQEDLSASVHSLIGKQAKDEQFTTNVSECVQFNSELLNAIIVRVNTVEAAVKLSDTKTEYLNTKVGELQEETKQCLLTVEGKLKEKDDMMNKKDETLRSELSAMANKLKNGHNQNEVIIVSKNIVNKGFFEKFFQLFG